MAANYNNLAQIAEKGKNHRRKSPCFYHNAPKKGSFPCPICPKFVLFVNLTFKTDFFAGLGVLQKKEAQNFAPLAWIFFGYINEIRHAKYCVSTEDYFCITITPFIKMVLPFSATMLYTFCMPPACSVFCSTV
jgi:hypothetical protein